MANLEEDSIRRQYLSKILPPKLAPLKKDIPTPSEFLLGNNLNDRIGTIETSQKTCKDFQKALKIKTKSLTAAAKPEATTTTKNNDRGINDCNTARETELQ